MNVRELITALEDFGDHLAVQVLDSSGKSDRLLDFDVEYRGDYAMVVIEIAEEGD